MKIGIFLGYAPSSGPELTSHGLGRYLAGLLKGLLEEGNHVVIACPHWMEEPLALLCEDQKIDITKINLVSVPDPVSISIMAWLLERGKKIKRPRTNFTKLFADTTFEIASFFISLTNRSVFVAFCLLALFTAIILIPLAGLVLLLCAIVWGLVSLVIRNPAQKIRRVFSAAFWKSKLSRWKKPIRRNLIEIVYGLYLEVMHRVRLSLVAKINHLDCADIWFSPAMHWPEFNTINGVKIITAPDLVTSNYPHGFAGTRMLAYSELIRETIKGGSYFVTYCDYLKENLLIKDFNKAPENIAVLPHAVNNLDEYIDIYSNTRHLNPPETANAAFARQQLNTLKHMAEMPSIGRVRDYLSGFDFTNVRYIFYSSQIRPHKNVLNLIKAYEYVLRRKYCQVKLVLTGNYAASKEVREYIEERRLEYDVISFSSVPSQLLACLYCCAELSLNPTLYEGGFPFTFAEGMSVGTPSVMSRIPQTLEVLGKYDCDDFLFDPYDWQDMADKIIYGLENRDLLYAKQLAIYDEFKTRTWGVVAKEYVETFQYFINQAKM